MLAAEAADPANVQIQLNLSALAISLGRADIAVTHLREAKLLDTTGSHASDAAMLQVEVDKMAENTPPPIHSEEFHPPYLRRPSTDEMAPWTGKTNLLRESERRHGGKEGGNQSK